MADPKTWVDLVPQYYVAGARQTQVVFDKRTAVGPASYTQGTGIAVDLSSVFSALHAVRVLRVFVTSTDAHSPYKVEVSQAGTDTFANRKFRVLFYQQNDPASVTGAVKTNAGGGIMGAGFVALASTSNQNTGIPSAQVDAGSGLAVADPASGAHTHTVANDWIADHDHDISTSAAAFPEVTGTTDLSTVTVEYEAVGVLA